MDDCIASGGAAKPGRGGSAPPGPGTLPGRAGVAPFVGEKGGGWPGKLWGGYEGVGTPGKAAGGAP